MAMEWNTNLFTLCQINITVVIIIHLGVKSRDGLIPQSILLAHQVSFIAAVTTYSILVYSGIVQWIRPLNQSLESNDPELKSKSS